MLVEKAYQIIPGNLFTQYDPTVGGVKLVVKGGLKSGERKLAGAGVFTAGCTPFVVPLHSSLHLYPLKFRKILLNTDFFSTFTLYQQTLHNIILMLYDKKKQHKLKIILSKFFY